jgi:GT2 family glycosyltransferase
LENPIVSSVLVSLSKSEALERGISVIVPTYCRASEIDTLLFPSLIEQTMHPREVIVVDDTPDDSVKLICEKWSPPFATSKVPVIYLRNPLQRSAANAKKYGGSRASGDLLTFLDSDLILDRDYLKCIREVFLKDPLSVGAQGHITNSLSTPEIQAFDRVIKHPEGTIYAILSSILRNFLAITIPSTNSCQIFEYPRTLNRTITCDWVLGSNTTIKQGVFASIAPDEGLKGYSYGEDVLLSLQLRRLGRLYITPHAKCKHLGSPSGRMDRASLLWQEKYFLGKVFRLRGSTVYYSRRLFFALTGALGLLSK